MSTMSIPSEVNKELKAEKEEGWEAFAWNGVKADAKTACSWPLDQNNADTQNFQEKQDRSVSWRRTRREQKCRLEL